LRQEFEYKFIRLGEGRSNVKREAQKTYREVVRAHAIEGWRLVQVFAPPIGGFGSGAAKYFEIILERRVSSD
jgi:hypothetical protein